MNDLESATRALFDLAVPISLGIAAALAHVGKHGWPGIARFFRILILCSFYGVVMYWLLALVNVPEMAKYGMTGGGVFCFLQLGDAIFGRVRRLIENFELSQLFRGGK